MPYKANESRRHKIPRARYRVENWAAYDAALRRRGDLTIWVTPEVITAWTPPATERRGRPARYSDIAIEAGVMLRLAFGRPWRQTEGLLGSLMRLLGLTLPVPDHTTLSRRSADLEIAAALSSTDGPVSVVIDSTGLKVLSVPIGYWLFRKPDAAEPDGTGRADTSALGGAKHPLPQEVEPSSPIHLAFDGFEPIDLPLHRAGAPAQRQRGADSRQVPLQSVGKAGQRCFAGGGQPAIELVGLLAADDVAERASQLDDALQR